MVTFQTSWVLCLLPLSLALLYPNLISLSYV